LPIRFGYLGLIHPNKGLEVLLEAATRLPEGTWTLNIAGQGFTAYERHLHTKYRETPAIRFLGYVKPEVLLQQTDVLVVPSLLSETFGRVVIEAYAHGVPVIASNRGGIPELVEPGDTGYLIDPSYPNQLAMKMQWFIDDPTMIEKMRSSCFKDAKRFVHANVVEQYLDLYHNVDRRR
jgi:glycosyltransferase involved in cell wall biosynthesis